MLADANTKSTKGAKSNHKRVRSYGKKISIA
jgi:hypothetical protein